MHVLYLIDLKPNYVKTTAIVLIVFIYNVNIDGASARQSHILRDF